MQTEIYMENKKRALIAMSGGVDSSVAACLIQEQGMECVGCTMKLYENEDAGIPKGHTCCSLDDVEDARRVCYRLGMLHYVFNFTDDFREKIIDRFICSYQQGITPNPCIDCNRFMKFDKLFYRAKALDCDYVVSGHYARIREQDGKYQLLKAVDETKDQSYVLYSMTQEQLAHTLFPLGGLEKTEVRSIAEAHDFVNANKPDSQDICFVPDGDYARVIELRTGQKSEPGDFVDMEGNVLGRHKGIIHYTIGQRRGLGLALKASMYVVKIDVKNNRVILGFNEDLFSTDVNIKEFNWISGTAPEGPVRCKAKIRYRQKEQWATAVAVGEDRVKVVFDEPQRAVTAGQAAVLYDGDVVLGGGVITVEE